MLPKRVMGLQLFSLARSPDCDQTFIDVGRGRIGSQHRQEGKKQHRRYLFFEFLEEFHGQPVVPWSFPFGESFDGVIDILRERSLVSLSFIACVTLAGTLFQQTV